MCLSAPFTASDQRYQWLSCHALTSAIPGLSQLVLAPYRKLTPYKPRRRPDASTTMPRLAYRRAVVPVSLRYNTTSPLYHLQVSVQHLRIVTERAQEQKMRISLHEPCLYATFSGALMHIYIPINQSTSSTTSPLYHLQVPVQHLRFVTETAHGRRTSTGISP